MGQPLRRIRGQMVHRVRAEILENRAQVGEDRGAKEPRSDGNVFAEAAGQIVDHQDLVALLDQHPRDVRTDKSRTAGYNRFHGFRPPNWDVEFRAISQPVEIVEKSALPAGGTVAVLTIRQFAAGAGLPVLTSQRRLRASAIFEAPKRDRAASKAAAPW